MGVNISLSWNNGRRIIRSKKWIVWTEERVDYISKWSTEACSRKRLSTDKLLVRSNVFWKCDICSQEGTPWLLKCAHVHKFSDPQIIRPSSSKTSDNQQKETWCWDNGLNNDINIRPQIISLPQIADSKYAWATLFRSSRSSLFAKWPKTNCDVTISLES